MGWFPKTQHVIIQPWGSDSNTSGFMELWNILSWKGPTRMMGPHSWSQYIAAHLAHRIFLCSVLNAKMTFQILVSHKPLLISREISHFQAITVCRPSGMKLRWVYVWEMKALSGEHKASCPLFPQKEIKERLQARRWNRRPAASPQWQRRWIKGSHNLPCTLLQF